MVKVKHVCFWWFHLKTLLYSVNTIHFYRGALKYQMPVTWLYHVHDKMNLNWKLVLKSYRIIQYCKQTFICCIYFAIFQLKSGSQLLIFMTKSHRAENIFSYAIKCWFTILLVHNIDALLIPVKTCKFRTKVSGLTRLNCMFKHAWISSLTL